MFKHFAKYRKNRNYHSQAGNQPMPAISDSFENATVYSEIALTIPGSEATSDSAAPTLADTVLTLADTVETSRNILPISGNDATKTSCGATSKCGDNVAISSDVLLLSVDEANMLDRGETNGGAITSSSDGFTPSGFVATRTSDDEATRLALSDACDATYCGSVATSSNLIPSSGERRGKSCTPPSVLRSPGCCGLHGRYMTRRRQHIAQWTKPVATVVKTTTSKEPIGLSE